MGIFSSNKKQEIDPKVVVEIEKKSAKEWIPIKDVRDGIIHLKNGDYVKLMEVIPVNFKLKSSFERKMIILNYRSFLKACKFPMQISIQCRKANVEPHVNKMTKFLEIEKNENVKTMIKGYISLVKMIGGKGAITRRYFLIVPHVVPVGIKSSSYQDVIKQLNEKQIVIKDFLSKCGNEVLINNDTEFAVDVLYSYLNKRTSEVQKIGKKLLYLTGTFIDSIDENGDDE